MCLTSCPAGYFADNLTSICVLCPPTCSLCTSLSNCTVCATGYTLSSTYQCVSTTPSQCTVPNCISCLWSTSSSLQNCSQCISGYSLHNGACVTVCPEAYYSVSGLCVACSANCLNCSASGCSLCDSTHF